MDKAEIAGKIDHTLLKADATMDDIARLCDEAVEHGFYSVAVNSCWTSLCANRLAATGVKVTTCIGFPLGAMATEAKVAETVCAVADGTDEIDMVLNIGKFLGGERAAVEHDIASVVKAARGRPVKVILECCLLDEKQIEDACRICIVSGASFVKTSTGFSKGGATVDDVRLMAKMVDKTNVRVKAAGGIHDFSDAKEMVDAGADRIGTSSGIKIMSAFG